jgi:crotonobetainyl-CoA:carnitine CoA-transferase CaiB-like acyl-CoA transferase
VLDLTRVRSGPTCVRQLADWGANVIKIDALLEDAAGEQPGGPRHGSDFQNLHRNKRAMSLNLKDPKGLEVFRRVEAFVEQAGILVLASHSTEICRRWCNKAVWMERGEVKMAADISAVLDSYNSVAVA